MYNDLFKPTHLQKLCQECSLNPSKKYGQNYLITEAPIKKMLEVAKIKKNRYNFRNWSRFWCFNFSFGKRS